MPKQVMYLYYGPQCFGAQYMGKQAEGLAERLNFRYQAIDISQQAVPEGIKVYTSGTIIIDDFVVTYPGRVEQLLTSYRQRGPLQGVHVYNNKPAMEPDEIKPMIDVCDQAAQICLPSVPKRVYPNKLNWLKKQRAFTGGSVGLVSFNKGKPVAAVEWVLESKAPFSISDKSSDRLFITCIYNHPHAAYDYRHALMREMKAYVKRQGLAGIRVISGMETPYPNGPISFFTNNGFLVTRQLGRILLRYKWEDIVLAEWRVSK